jgi:hypothetical protein
MRSHMGWVVVGAGLMAGCRGPQPAAPPSPPGPGASLEWSQQGQVLRLSPKSAETSYLVVVLGDAPASPAAAGPEASVVLKHEFGSATVDTTAGRATVYALTPVLFCPPGQECAECEPGGGPTPDCGVPPTPLPTWPRHARSLSFVTKAPAGP